MSADDPTDPTDDTTNTSGGTTNTSDDTTNTSDDTINTTTNTTNTTDESQVATASAPDRSERETSAGVASGASHRARRKTRIGVVTSGGMDKTAVVSVVERVRHPKYNKFVLQTKRLYAHDETNDVNVGDRVRVMETRPLSKTKRWRVVEVLERAR